MPSHLAGLLFLEKKSDHYLTFIPMGLLWQAPSLYPSFAPLLPVRLIVIKSADQCKWFLQSNLK